MANVECNSHETHNIFPNLNAISLINNSLD